METDDILEWLKIIIALLVGYVIIKGLLIGSGTIPSHVSTDEIKCLCDCAEQVHHLG